MKKYYGVLRKLFDRCLQCLKGKLMKVKVKICCKSLRGERSMYFGE